MDEQPDYRSEYYRLKTQNQILQSELEYRSQREVNLTRELQIMSQLHSDRNQDHFYEKQQSLEEEIDRLNKLVISYLTEKEQTDSVILGLQQKISDLKYNNGQLKSLNEKLTHLHSKEIDMMRREALQTSSNEAEKKLLKEKQILEKKLAKCSETVQQMESYYTLEIKRKNEIIKAKDEEIRGLIRELEGARTQRQEGRETIGGERWQKRIDGIREQYEGEISELKGKVKFLIGKIENMQSVEQWPSKVSLGSISNQPLAQSKMLQSASSIESARPNRENPIRRNTSGMKTPNKYVPSRTGRPLAERNLN